MGKIKKFIFGGGDYGFLKADDLPAGPYKEFFASQGLKEFVTTGATGDTLNNHCGATAATNLALNFIHDDWQKIFARAYAMIGEGPALFIGHKVKRLFSSYKKKVKTRVYRSRDKIKKSIIRRRLSILLLANGLFDWHYVLCLGYRTYESGDDYLILADGWTKTLTYYKINAGSLLFSATVYDLII